MKKQLSLILFLLGFGISFSQTKPTIQPPDTVKLKSGSYEFTQSLPKEFISLKEYGTGDEFDLKKGRKINYLYSIEGRAYFKYWKFKDDGLFKILNNAGNGDLIFSMELKDFEKLVRPLYKKFKGIEVGAYTIPFRLRGAGGGDNFDFESSLSIQANFVAGFGSIYKEDSWIDLSFGLGLTEVNLTDSNSNVTEDRTASAFTYSLGTVIKANRFANIGLFFGVDNLGRNDNEVDWKYDGKIWIGLGINVSFNAISTNDFASENKDGQQDND